MKQPIFEITLAKGFGYVSLLRSHPTYGDILGVDLTLYRKPLVRLGTFNVNRIVISPLLAAIKATAVSARKIEERTVQNDPDIIFKFAVRDNAGDPIYWWLWDGDVIKIADADEDLSSLPERRVLTPVELLNSWCPGNGH